MGRKMGQAMAGKVNNRLHAEISRGSKLCDALAALSEIHTPRKTNISDDWLKKGYDLGRYRFYEDAIRCFNAAIELNSLDPLAWKCKGLTLEACGRSSEADIAFAKARALGLMVR